MSLKAIFSAGFELHFQRDELDFVLQKIGLKNKNFKIQQQASQAWKLLDFFCLKLASSLFSICTVPIPTYNFYLALT